MNNEINNMKNNIKYLNEIILKKEEEKKCIIRAILIFDKKIQEIKNENKKFDNNKKNLNKNINSIFDFYNKNPLL
jgi:septal ring factor EnvC (AmiA/AmiB activator)